MKSSPSISVIVNTFNSSRFIFGTIKSLQKQTFSDFEIIIIDDGSEDNTLDIVSNIKEPRIKIYTHSNAGIAASRNRGIERSSSEFIAFMDHDDLWHNKKLEHQVQVLIDNPNAGFAYSYVKAIDESGDVIRCYAETSDIQNAYKNLLVKNFLHTASNPLIRREHLLRIGGFDESIYGADDWDLFIRLAAQAPVAVSPYHEVCYRIVKGSASAKVEKIEQGCLKVIDKAFEQAPLALQPSKEKSLGIVYQYLCFRVLEEAANQRSGLKAFQYLRCSYSHSPSLWKINVFFKTVIKISVILFLSPRLLKVLTLKFRPKTLLD